MKKQFALFFGLLVLIVSMGCIQVPIDAPSWDIRTTGFPSRNRVVVSCPPSIALVKIERLDQWGKKAWAAKSGETVSIPASGMFGDQSFVLVAYGYNLACQNDKGEDTYTLVGRTSPREFRFYQNDNISGQVLTWDIQASDFRR